MTTEKKNINIKVLILSLIPILVAFIINKSTIIRILLCLLSLFILIYILKNKKHKLLIIITILLLTVLLDSFISYTFKRIPIFSYNIVNNGNVTVYNAVGIRVWQCDSTTKNIKVDLFNKQGYLCDMSNIETVYSNSFLSTVIENYSDYKNQYVKINGKISKKNGLNYIEMQAYDPSSESINGTVSFYENITLRILFTNNEEELNNYDIYDNITVIGSIKNLETINGNHYIYMSDAKVLSIKRLDKYELSFTIDNNCNEKTLIYSDDKEEIYEYCLLNAFITYEDGTKYELGSVLSSGKLNIDEMITNYKNKEEDKENILYKFGNYNILVCNNTEKENIIIGSNKINTKMCN